MEHYSDGKGIFTSHLMQKSFDNGLFDPLLTRHTIFPAPYEEKCLQQHWIQGTSFCAYNSVDALLRWVTSTEMQELIDMGFKVLQLSVSTCHVSSFQTIYKKKHVMATLDITNNITYDTNNNVTNLDTVQSKRSTGVSRGWFYKKITQWVSIFNTKKQ